MAVKTGKLEQELCFQLYVASKEVIRRYQPYLREHSLTYTSFIALRAIEDGMSVRELGAQLYLDSGTLSPLLKKLEGQQLLTRVRGTEDERVLVLHLTEQGKALQAQLPALSSQVFQDVSHDIPELSVEQLLDNLHQLNRAFKTV